MTRLGPVTLAVRNSQRACEFYEHALGLHVQRQEGGVTVLGADGEELLILRERLEAQRAGRHAGLYHVALLYPSREELARAAVRLGSTRTPIQGASDHGTHEAIYLADPDGNGLELAADRPRERWPDVSDQRLYSAGPQPLDIDGLLALVHGAPTRAHAAQGLRIGHVHLHVADTAAALRFYTEAIGFEKVVELGRSAAFVAVDGYHHHLAFNTWRGEGVPPAPADAVGLVHWTISLPSAADVAAVRERLEHSGVGYTIRDAGLLVRDPSGNAVLVEATSA
jgi:catechol 2,3-dioxygenase